MAVNTAILEMVSCVAGIPALCSGPNLGEAMKTTVDLPDKLLREVKAISAKRGISMKEFMIEALQRTVQLAMSRGPEPGWKQCFGTFRGRGKETRDIQNTIDREFSRIDPKDWK